jgi:hypothetical protein
VRVWTGFPIVEETWPAYDAVNVQVGLDAWLGEAFREHELVGMDPRMGAELAQLLAPPMGLPVMHMPQSVNVARVNRPCGPDDQVLACVQSGLYLVTEPQRRSVLLVRAGGPQMGNPVVSVQIVSTDFEYPAQVAADLRRLALENNVFRGQVLSFGGEVFGHGKVLLQFHRRPVMETSELVLDPRVLEQVRASSRAHRPTQGHPAQRRAASQTGGYCSTGHRGLARHTQSAI